MKWKEKIGDFLLPFHSNQVKQDLSFCRRIRDGSYITMNWAKKLVSSPSLREGPLLFLGTGADCRERRARWEKFFAQGTGRIGRRKHPFMLWRCYEKRYYRNANVAGRAYE